MDPISHLPDFIVHHILSFITSPEELVRMSLLSKNWFHLTASFPILDFNLNNFDKVSRQSFFKYIEYTTSRFCHQNVTAHKLKINARILKDPAELDVVNRCLESVLKIGVRELVIDIANFWHIQKCRLPNTLLYVSALKSLTIRGCELPSSLMVDAIKFNSLIRLELALMHIDDELITRLTTSCPLLQEFLITRCHGFKIFCVHEHQNLQRVYIHHNNPLKSIDIEAPNLSNLTVFDVEDKEPPQINVALCKKLTTVIYVGYSLQNTNGFTNFLYNFPFTENLILSTKDKCKNLKFSSRALKTLVLHSDCDLEDIELNAPNLVSFHHVYRPLLFLPSSFDTRKTLVRGSTNSKACIKRNPSYTCYANILWFRKLRQFLDKKNGFKPLNLYIRATYSQKSTDLANLKATEMPPYELEHVELHLDTIYKESSAHIDFVDAILWCCRPQSLTLRSFYILTDFEDVVKFTYMKLLEQEVEGHTKIQIVGLFSPEAQKHSMDFESLLMALPLQETTTITFIKEQVV